MSHLQRGHFRFQGEEFVLEPLDGNIHESRRTISAYMTRPMHMVYPRKDDPIVYDMDNGKRIKYPLHCDAQITQLGFGRVSSGEMSTWHMNRINIVTFYVLSLYPPVLFKCLINNTEYHNHYLLHIFMIISAPLTLQSPP